MVEDAEERVVGRVPARDLSIVVRGCVVAPVSTCVIDDCHWLRSFQPVQDGVDFRPRRKVKATDLDTKSFLSEMICEADTNAR